MVHQRQTRESFKILILHSLLPTTQCLSRPESIASLTTQYGTQNHSRSHLLPHGPCFPFCWQTTKQKKLHTELLPTAHHKARPVFIYFFLHCLSFHDVNYVSSPFPMSPKFFHCRGPHTLADSSSSRRPPPTSLLCSRSPFTRMTWT